MKIEFIALQTDLLLVGARQSRFCIGVFLFFHRFVIGVCMFFGQQTDVSDVLLQRSVLSNSRHCTISESVQDQGWKSTEFNVY